MQRVVLFNYMHVNTLSFRFLKINRGLFHVLRGGLGFSLLSFLCRVARCALLLPSCIFVPGVELTMGFLLDCAPVDVLLPFSRH